MIKLNDNTNNTFVVTASENVTLTGTTYFLFEVISDDTRQAKYFVPEDLSTNTCRFNEFQVTVTGGTETLTGSTININLNPIGYYKYNIYQQHSNTNLDPSLASGIVETGKLYLSGQTQPVITSYTGNTNESNNTYISYEG